MGQTKSTESGSPTIPEAVENFQDEIVRHARNITEIAALTYNDFQNCLFQINSFSQRCTDSDGKQLLFAVKKGTDSGVLWRGTVRIACVKVDRQTNKIESYRLLNLSEFLKVSRTLQCQLAAAEQSSQTESTSTETTDSGAVSNKESPGLVNMDVTALLMGEVEFIQSAADRLNECCICLERKPDVMLPCAHSYCLPCIEQWNVNNKTCPICRETLESTDDTWVISEMPGSHEISEEIMCSLMHLASKPTEKTPP